MAQTWMRLDTDFFLDRKVEQLEDVRKEAGIYKWIKLCALATEEYGRLDLNKAGIRPYVEKRVKLKGKRLDDFIADCVDCGLFDADLWSAGIITSERLLNEGEKRARLEQQRRDAAQASVEARRNKNG